MRFAKVLPAGLVLAGFAVAALAQEDAVFKSGVDVVSLLATVRDGQGRLVNDLTKDDFVLKEDGQLQTIRYFERQADLPLTVGLLVDTSLSQGRILEQERSAGSEFFSRVVDESKDQAFVVSFDFEVELLQDLTSSKALLQRALQDLELPAGRVYRTGPARPLQWSSPWPSNWSSRWIEPSQQFPGGGIPNPFPRDRSRRRLPRSPRGGGPSGGGGGAIGTSMYDAVYLAANEVLNDQVGR